MRKLMVVPLALAAFLVFGLGTTSAHDKSFKTASSFGFYNGSPDAFLGDITSPNTSCERGRIVKVFRKRPGRDRLVGSDRSDAGGIWEVERNNVARGNYYAKVLKKRIAPRNSSHRHVCRAYRSSTLPFG